MEGRCGRRIIYRSVYAFYSSVCPRKKVQHKRAPYFFIDDHVFIGGMQPMYRVERCAAAVMRCASERKRERVLGVLTSGRATFDGGRVEQSFSRPKLSRGQIPRQQAIEAHSFNEAPLSFAVGPPRKQEHRSVYDTVYLSSQGLGADRTRAVQGKRYKQTQSGNPERIDRPCGRVYLTRTTSPLTP